VASALSRFVYADVLFNGNKSEFKITGNLRRLNVNRRL